MSLKNPSNVERFEGPYRFLSNFWPSPIVSNGLLHPTAEHAYQAAKTHDLALRGKISRAVSPSAAKRIGSKVPLRPFWDDMKIGIMGEILTLKFMYPELMQQLQDTGRLRLVEGNTWDDRFWGECHGQGRNELGKLLMRIRAGNG